jgi:hypothetical protein
VIPLGKKKKKKEKSISILNEIDNSLNESYTDLMQEIQDYQMEIYIADKKYREKLEKKLKKDPYYFDTGGKSKARKKTLAKMESNNFFDRVEKALKDLSPIIIIIGRLICSLILSILSIDTVKTSISKGTLDKMSSVYQIAYSVGR